MEASSLKQSYANTCLWVALSQWILDFHKTREECYGIALQLFKAIDDFFKKNSQKAFANDILEKIKHNLELLGRHFEDRPIAIDLWDKQWGEVMEHLLALAPITDNNFLGSSSHHALVKKSIFFTLKRLLWSCKILRGPSETVDVSAKSVLTWIEKITGVEFTFLRFKKNELASCTPDQILSLYACMENCGSIIITHEHAIYYRKTGSKIMIWDPEIGHCHVMEAAQWLEAMWGLSAIWIVPKIYSRLI